MPRDKTGHFYFPWYPTIYEQDTQSLSLAECGAYRRLIDHYMVTRAPLPSDDRALARIIGTGLDEWLAVKPAVVTYFKPTGLLLKHEFCDEVLGNDKARILRSQENGSKGGRPKALKDNANNPPGSDIKPSSNPLGTPKTKQNKTEVSKGTDLIQFNGKEKELAETSDEILPGPWLAYAETRGLSNERIYQTWERFKDRNCPTPFRFDRWQGWLERERA